MKVTIAGAAAMRGADAGRLVMVLSPISGLASAA